MTVRKILSLCSLSAALVLSGVPRLARADTTLVSPFDMSVAGVGTMEPVMTMQSTGIQMGSVQSGCVGVSDTGRLSTTIQWLQQHHQTDPDLCQGGNTGGSEVPISQFPQNQTLLVSDASNLAIVFNSDQPGGGVVSLSRLVFALFNANGQVGFATGTSSQLFSTESTPGMGTSGWEFVLDPTQAAQAQAAIDAGYNLFGLSATVANSLGGPESFYLINRPTTSMPEPSILWLLGAGLVLAGAIHRVRSGFNHPPRRASGSG
ncbi:MAG TPA: hypothetical protein VGR58_03690 [Candidatus Acidoferrum sp.]|nr:hypothetical protein [Candidatus Acidoferrum sp.]